MAVAWLGRLASAAPVPVFAAGGAGVGSLLVELAGHPDVRLVPTPRHASVLVAAGRFPGELAESLARVHDALPHPRDVVVVGEGDQPAELRDAAVAAGDDPVVEIVAVHRAVCTGARPSRPDLRPDVPPHPFEGRGDHGQGGEGMMGGVPFGRPMAMTGDDLRDGLSLDQLSLRLGPFLPGLPSTVALDVALQGDVVQEAHLRSLAVADAPAVGKGLAGEGVVPDPVLACFERARHEPVPVAELERARARHLLRWLAGACHLAGLGSLATRAAACARSLGLVIGVGQAGVAAGEVSSAALMSDETAHLSQRVARLGWAVRSSGLAAVWSDVGKLPADHAALTGAGARAGGREIDARRDDPAYRRLSFTVPTRDGGDARARLEQRLVEVQQAIDLAAAAERYGSVHDPGDPLEPLQGAAADAATLTALSEHLVGMEWGDALVTVCSLDLTAETVPAVETSA